jgi:endonuclease/exonuclease/phosphatase family metal-dependent hydrolase
MRAARLAAALLVAVLAGSCAGDQPGGESPDIELSVMTFNIEYGGDGVDFGRLARAIQAAGADVVGIQEAWGHLPRLAADLGWDHVDTRMQVVSRYPLIDPGGADGRYLLVELLPGRVVALGNVHLPSDPYGPSAVLDGATAESVLELERRVRLPAISQELELLAALHAKGIPAFLTGDINSPSFADWTAAAVGTRPHVRYELDWPVSRAIERAGFRDSYRDLHPNPMAEPGLTWPAGRPRVEGWNPAPDDPHERIDFVFSTGDATTLESRIVGEPGASDVDIAVEPWPTDHRAVVSAFRVKPVETPTLVSVEKRSVTVGTALVVAFNSAGRQAERVDVRRPGGDPAGRVLSEPVTAGDGPELGRVRFNTESLAPGAYEVVLFAGGERELARTEVWLSAVGAVPEVRVAGGRRSSGEPFAVEWSDAPGSRWDWIGVHPAGADPLTDPLLLWRHTGATIVGQTIFDESAEGNGWPLPAGVYRVSLFVDDSYERLASAALVVEDSDGPASGPDVGEDLINQSERRQGPLDVGAEPEADSLVETDHVARDQQNAPLLADSLDQLAAADRQVVFRVGDGARRRRCPGEMVLMGSEPGFEGWVVCAQDRPGPAEDSLPRVGPHGESSQHVGHHSRRQRGVVVALPESADELGRRDDPAHPQARHGKCLRESAGDDDAIVASPEGRRRFVAAELRAAVDLIRHDPRSHPVCGVGDRAHLVLGENVPGRVVRIADHDRPGALGDGSVQPVQVQTPLPAIEHEPERVGGLPEVPGQTPSLHVVGDHEGQPVTRLEQGPQGQEVGLGAAVGQAHVVRTRTRVPHRDVAPGLE